MLLAFSNTVKPDIGFTLAELVYGKTRRLPGEYFHPAQPASRPFQLVTILREFMSQLRFVPGTNHNTRHTTFVSDELQKISHIFICIDAAKPPLQAKHEGHVKSSNAMRKLSRINATVPQRGSHSTDLSLHSHSGTTQFRPNVCCRHGAFGH